MTQKTEPEELKLVLLLLRAARGWTQKELAEEMETSPSLLSEYESGKRAASLRVVERAVRATGTSPEVLDVLLPAVRMLCASMRGQPQDDAVLLAYSLSGQIRDTLEPLIRDFLESLKYLEPSWIASSPTPRDREEAPLLWERLASLSRDNQRFLVAEAQEYQSWALCELLCEESVKESNAGKSLELAKLALHLAEKIRGADEAWLSRLQGYAWAHVGYARRAGGDMTGAAEAFARFRQLWQAGTSGDPEALLDEARVLLVVEGA
ncbi:MAG TPA: helix-turn-helix transcriptional regulator [Thermoanaerobaculia bacterium]|nr:helix-turn-helix transcriptional regulator [Thermoanaerobaculia bacterium]